MNTSPLLERIASLSEEKSASLGPLCYFDLPKFVSELQERWALSDLAISIEKSYWVTKEDADKIVNDQAIAIHAHPILGDLYFSLEKEQIVKLLSWIIEDEEDQPSLSSDVLQEGFYHYLLLEALDLLTKTPLFSRMAPKISLQEDFSEELFALSFVFTHKNETVKPILYVTKSFKDSFSQYFTEWKKDLPKATFFVDVPIKAHVTIGEISLEPSQIQSLALGDLVLFDTLFFHPMKKQGTAQFSLKGAPLFTLSIENTKATIASLIPNMEPNMESTPENDPHSLEETLGAIPLKVKVDLAELDFSLKELSALSQGSTIHLPDDSGHTVSLNVQGQKIAQGELVQIGDSLAVRITSIHHFTPSAEKTSE